MATSGGPICTLVYLLSLIDSGDDLNVAYHAMYSVSIFLPMLVMFIRWRMQNGDLFEKSNFKGSEIPWTLLVKKY